MRRARGAAAQLLVRGVDSAVVQKLKVRARRSGRSLQAELRALLERAVQLDFGTARTRAARMRRRLAGRSHTDSAVLLAEDRLR